MTDNSDTTPEMPLEERVAQLEREVRLLKTKLDITVEKVSAIKMDVLCIFIPIFERLKILDPRVHDLLAAEYRGLYDRIPESKVDKSYRMLWMVASWFDLPTADILDFPSTMTPHNQDEPEDHE